MTNNSLRMRAAKSGSRMMHGGYSEVEPLDSEEANWVDALIDTLIPPEDGWPTAAELGVSGLLVSYLVPKEAPVSLYPHFTRDEFPQLARRMLQGSKETLEGKVAALRTAEKSEPEQFALLRDFVYYIYYGHPNVVALIRKSTSYGADYLGGGQPEGYKQVLEDWGGRKFTDRGVFIPTTAVRRVPQAEGAL